MSSGSASKDRAPRVLPTTQEPSRESVRRRRRASTSPTPEVWMPGHDRSPTATAGTVGAQNSVGRHLATLALGVVAVVIAVWLLAGALFTILHLVELIAVAGGAGWVGYRIGWFRGRRQRSSSQDHRG